MSMMKTTNAEKDLALVKALKSGNKKESREALETLFKKYHDLILFRYRSMTKNELDAEDLAMEAFEKCYEKIGQYNEETAAFSTWLFTLTRNLFIDSLRKKKEETIAISDMIVSDEDGSMVEKEFESDVRNPEEEILREERHMKLKEIIDITFADKPHLKELIELRYFADMSYHEMADLTDRPLGTVKAHLFRAKDILAKACEAAGLKV